MCTVLSMNLGLLLSGTIGCRFQHSGTSMIGNVVRKEKSHFWLNPVKGDLVTMPGWWWNYCLNGRNQHFFGFEEQQKLVWQRDSYAVGDASCPGEG